MKIWNRSIVLAGLLAACAGSAMAQPTLTENLGALSNGSLTRQVPLAGPGIFWYKLTVPAVTTADGYLDIGTRGGAISGLDTEIGLYNSAGTMLKNDDDDGSVFYSALSFGNASSPRAADGSGLAFNGRDGSLPAGEYYLAAGLYNVTFGAANWTVTSASGGAGGDTTLFINFAADTLPSNPSCGIAVAPATIRNDGTGTVNFTVTVIPGTFPASTAHTVTMDTSSLGDPSTQPVTFVQGPANVFTYSLPIGAGLGAGTYAMTSTVLETAPRSRTSICTANVVIVNPPTGQCCTGDGCLRLTAADCAAQGGTYGGDNTTCGACSCVTGIPNDNIEDAIELSNGSVETGTTCGATIDTGNALCNGQTISAGGVWYSAVGTGNTMTATLCGGPSYDSRISVYCNAGGALTCVGGNDDSCALLSTVAFCTQESAQYYILVHGFGTATGAFQISLTDDSTPCTGGVFCIPTGACCTGDGCSIVTADTCAGLGGTYNGDGTVCFTDGVAAVGTATDTPVFIPDSAGGIPGAASSSLTIGAGSGTITDLAVGVGLTHTFVGDLIVTVSNGSTSAILTSRQGGGTNVNGVFTFVDSAPLNMTAAAAAAGADLGSSRILPFQSLSVFTGANYEGTWTLSVTDNAGIDVGNIESFEIGSAFTTSNCAPACAPCAADYNQDGGVDGGDISSFFPDWENSASCADVNLDGGVDGGDIEAFFAVWEAGGC
ncbi:MAG: proprotein convertase P-domain-containing protein [Planctomycetota bacterium]|nr:proprotein convertase P-domain-containing protein [Planctomycetota bacterium]